MAYKQLSPQAVVEGGTGASSLTDHSVLIGSGTGAITAITVGGTGELLVGAATADPAFGTSANGDFTFTSSTAAATRTLTVTNTDNTSTSSAAKVQITTGGSSAGDPTTTYTVSGTTNWTQGIDNTDSDAYVLAASTGLGTTNVIRASTAGEINYPLQPAFLTELSAPVSNVTGDGTDYTIAFDTEIFDQNGDLSGSTFTAPVTGRYYLGFGVYFNQVGAGHTGGHNYIVTSNRTYYCDWYNPANLRDSGSNLSMTRAIFGDMDSADTATIVVQMQNSTKVVDVSGNSSATNVTYFSGYLVC